MIKALLFVNACDFEIALINLRTFSFESTPRYLSFKSFVHFDNASVIFDKSNFNIAGNKALNSESKICSLSSNVLTSSGIKSSSLVFSSSVRFSKSLYLLANLKINSLIFSSEVMFLNIF